MKEIYTPFNEYRDIYPGYKLQIFADPLERNLSERWEVTLYRLLGRWRQMLAFLGEVKSIISGLVNAEGGNAPNAKL